MAESGHSMRVLSIDFDYFIDATAQAQAELFPDGDREYSDELNFIVWCGIYAKSLCSKADIYKIGVRWEKLRAVRELCERQSNPVCMIADSHEHAYKFIRDRDDGTPIEVYNIDFHHDTFPCNGEVDCGNWLRCLLEDKIIERAFWVAREDSNFDNNEAKVIPFSELPQDGYDLIYACRSGWWTPPHCDEAFITELVRPLLRHPKKWKCTYQNSLLNSRYSEEFQEEILKRIDMYSEVAKLKAAIDKENQ